MNNPSVYIVLVNYNGIQDTIECINSLRLIDYDNIKIIVIDNASADPCCLRLEHEFPEVLTIRSEINLGFAGGCNLGIRKALEHQADYVLLLNNDTIVTENFLTQMVQSFSVSDRIGILTCKILHYKDNSIWYGGGHINKWKGNGQTEHLGEMDNELIKSKFCTFASGCCMLISKALLEQVGLLRDNYFLYFEDTDYCVKVLRAGYKIYFDAAAVIYHKESQTTGKCSPLFTYYICRNRFLFIKQNFDLLCRLTADIYSVGYIIKNCAIGFFQSGYAIKGVKDAFMNRTGRKDTDQHENKCI